MGDADANAVRQFVVHIGAMGFGDQIEIVAAEFGEHLRDAEKLVWVGHDKASRGGQLRAGAGAASGRLIAFHHVDNPLTRDHVDALLAVSADPEIRGGAFHRDLGHCWPGWGFGSPISRWWERRFGILYGDQTCFVRREVLASIGGVPDLRLMEDVELSKKLRESGIVTLIDPPVQPSLRKFESDGKIRRKLHNMKLLSDWKRGATPEELYERYYGSGN